MTRIDVIALILLCTTLSVGLASPDGSGVAYEARAIRVEGRVMRIRIHLCGLEPGSCEGTLVLATASGGEVVLGIVPGIRLEHNMQLAMIEDVKVGDYVAAQAVQVAGEPLPRIVKLDITSGSCPLVATECTHGAE